MKNTRANYSPVRQMGHRAASEPRAASIELQANNPLRNRTYIDTSQTEQQFHLNPPGTNSNHVASNHPAPEEVYLCNCCGITRELAPGIRFMPAFRCIFYLFNFLVLVLGVASFGMGLWFRIDPKVYEIHKYIATQNFTVAGWLMLFCGLASCLVAVAGFAAATRQLASLLACYFFTMVVLTLAFVGTLVLLTVYGLGSQLEQFINKEIYEQIRRRTMNPDMDFLVSNDAAQFLDFVQVKMRCCGAVDFKDYLKLGMIIPTTCYTIDKNFVAAPGCGRAIRNLFDIRAGMAAGFVSGSILCQLFTTTLAALMFCSIYHWRAQPRSTTPTAQP